MMAYSTLFLLNSPSIFLTSSSGVIATKIGDTYLKVSHLILVMIEKYKIPEKYAETLQKLRNAKIDYCLFKQSPYANELIGGLDILFRNKNEYKCALGVLLKDGFKLYFTEKNEPYKTMLCKYSDGFMQVMHIHRAVGWLGLAIMDPILVLQRMKKVEDLIYVPSDEDSLIIHVGHILFENYQVKEYEGEILKQILRNEKLDWQYINLIVNKYGWYGAFHDFIYNFRNLTSSKIFYKLSYPLKVKKSFLFGVNVKKFFSHKMIRNLFFITKQFVQFFTKRINPRRKGLLVVFEGVNGSGKSTLSSAVIEKYTELLDKVNLKLFKYYFGWKPLLSVTKIVSKAINRNGKDEGIYKKLSEVQKVPGFDLKQELFFMYVWLEDVIRYYFYIYTKLQRRNIVVCDRYFYHMYGQYPYAAKSGLMKLLVKMFPNPDVLFVLDVPLNVLTERRKDVSEMNLKRQI